MSDVADGIPASKVSVTDALGPDGFDWEIVSQDGSACTISDADSDGFIDDLSCSPILADGGSYSLRVATTTAATALHCDQTFTNTAFAVADNAEQVSYDASITAQCGPVKVVRMAKHADTSGCHQRQPGGHVQDHRQERAGALRHDRRHDRHRVCGQPSPSARRLWSR